MSLSGTVRGAGTALELVGPRAGALMVDQTRRAQQHGSSLGGGEHGGTASTAARAPLRSVTGICTLVTDLRVGWVFLLPLICA